MSFQHYNFSEEEKQGGTSQQAFTDLAYQLDQSNVHVDSRHLKASGAPSLTFIATGHAPCLLIQSKSLQGAVLAKVLHLVNDLLQLLVLGQATADGEEQ